jgi:hypothetical protein
MALVAAELLADWVGKPAAVDASDAVTLFDAPSNGWRARRSSAGSP